MTAFKRLLIVQAKRSLREPAAMFFMVAFAPLFVIIMGVIFGNDPRPEFDNRGFLDANLVSFTSIVIAITSFLVIPLDLITQRKNGALRRFRATPLRPTVYIAADVVVRFVILLVSLGVMLALGLWVFGADIQGNIASVMIALVLGIVGFLALGYALAAALPSPEAAQGVGNSLTYPLIVLSGGAVPLSQLPDGVRHYAQISPLTQLVEFLQSLWTGGNWGENWVRILILVGLLAVATAAAAKFFRWE